MTLRLTRRGERPKPVLTEDDRTYREAVVDLFYWQHRSGKCFYSELFDLMTKADDANLVKLALAFPFHALAYERWKYSTSERGFFEEHGIMLATYGNIT